jgi:hypothetical protein
LLLIFNQFSANNKEKVKEQGGEIMRIGAMSCIMIGGVMGAMAGVAAAKMCESPAVKRMYKKGKRKAMKYARQLGM